MNTFLSKYCSFGVKCKLSLEFVLYLHSLKIDEWYNALERDRDLSGEQEGVYATLTLVVREGRGKGL